MTNLNWSGIQINSIEDIRRNFDLSETMKAFLNGSLEKWLSERYYDPQADALLKLDHEESDASICAVCETLGVPCPETQGMTPEERKRLELNQSIVRHYTDDAEALENAGALAENQSDLAALLDAGKTVICLCAGNFTVPLRKKGIRYLLIGDPTLCDAYTQEQYSNAGIVFVKVPSNSAQECFEHCDNSLADFLNMTMKTDRVQKKLKIAKNKGEDLTYRSRSEAKRMAEELFTPAYEQAAAYFDPNNDDCIAGATASEYANTLQEKMSAIVKALRHHGEAGQAIEQMDDMISEAESELRDSFLRNLAENSDFYRLYRKSYFLSGLRVKEVQAYSDSLMEIVDAIGEGINVFLDGITEAFDQMQDRPDDAKDEEAIGEDGEGEEKDDGTAPEYYIDGLDGVLEELQDDVDSRANAFYAAAYEQYKAYCERIELLAESLDLPDAFWTELMETV